MFFGIAFRDYHSLTHENPSLRRDVQIHDEQLFSVQPYTDQPQLYSAAIVNSTRIAL
jgi:hypothetical protein